MRKQIFIIISLLTLGCSTLFAQETASSDNAQLIENLTNHLNFLCADELLGRKAGSPEGKKAAEYLFNQYEEIGVNPQMEPFRNGKLQNVVSEIPSKNGKYILIGAHYDHLGHKGQKIFNGADDNASGTATLVELARILSEKRDELTYGVIFVAFDGEEEGLFGSKYNASVIDESKIALMISIDMVGHLCHEGRLIYEGTGTFENGEEIIRNALIDNVTARTYPQAVSNGVMTDTFFYDLKGIPVLNVLTGEETSEYHKVTDDIETLDIPGMALITQHLAKLVLTMPEIKPMNKSLYEDKQFRAGLSFEYISLTNNYFEQGLLLDSPFAFGAFAMAPIGKCIMGNIFLKPEVNVSLSHMIIDGEKENLTKLTFPVEFFLSQKVFGLEMMYGIGPYYSIMLNQNKDMNQEIGFRFGLDFKTYNNVSFVNHMGLGVYVNYGFQKMFNNNAFDIKKTKSASCVVSIYL